MQLPSLRRRRRRLPTPVEPASVRRDLCCCRRCASERDGAGDGDAQRRSPARALPPRAPSERASERADGRGAVRCGTTSKPGRARAHAPRRSPRPRARYLSARARGGGAAPGRKEKGAGPRRCQRGRAGENTRARASAHLAQPRRRGESGRGLADGRGGATPPSRPMGNPRACTCPGAKRTEGGRLAPSLWTPLQPLGVSTKVSARPGVAQARGLALSFQLLQGGAGSKT